MHKQKRTKKFADKRLNKPVKTLQSSVNGIVTPQAPSKLEKIALETSISAVSFADLNGRVIYANKAFLNLLGYKSEKEVLGRRTLEFFANKAEAKKMRAQLLKQGHWAGGTEGRKKDGSVFTVHLSTNLVKDERNVPLCTMAFFVDTTEVKKTIEAIKQSERNFKALFFGAAEGIIVADVKTKKFILANPAVCKMLGYTEQEMLKLSILDIHPKASLPAVLKNFEMQVKGLRSLAANLPCLRKDGSIFFADINAAKVLIEGKEYAAGFFSDITDRLQAEDAAKKAREELEIRVQQRTSELQKVNLELRKEMEQRFRAVKERADIEKRFRDIFENAVVGIYRTTPNGKILMANPALVKMLGYSTFDELKKRNLEKAGFEPSYPRSVFRQIMDKKGRVAGLESAWLRTDGRSIAVRESAVTVKDGGKILYYEGTVEDITERKKAEEQLLIYQKQLRSLALELSLSEERLRRQMAMNIHDHLGQNLAISKIKLDSLRKSLDDSEHLKKTDEICDLIHRAIDSTRSLTFELSPPVLYELGFEAAVEWLVGTLCKRENICWEFFNERKTKPLEPDVRILLFQSVREILVNITKHAFAKKISVAVNKVNSQIQVSIIDDGVGFELNKVKISDISKRGFGLFSVRERLANIGGRFEIESEPGKGTKVLLTAPLSKKQNAKKGG
jgi:PAS domain S-box-containing protein